MTSEHHDKHIWHHTKLLVPWIAIVSTLTFILLVAHFLGY